MSKGLGLVTFLVREYDEAIVYFIDCLGFRLLEDTRLSPKKTLGSGRER